MRILQSLSLIALTLSPTVALAGGCADRVKETTAAMCAVGMEWDAGKSACVATPTT